MVGEWRGKGVAEVEGVEPATATTLDHQVLPRSELEAYGVRGESDGKLARLVDVERDVVGRVEGEWTGRTLCSLKCASSSSGGPRSSI